MKRREFVGLVGGARARPLTAGAQLASRLPTIGFLGPTNPTSQARAAFSGLDAGYSDFSIR